MGYRRAAPKGMSDDQKRLLKFMRGKGSMTPEVVSEGMAAAFDDCGEADDWSRVLNALVGEGLVGMKSGGVGGVARYDLLTRTEERSAT